ncbi:flagellar basal body-associated FliL family protein [Rhabdochromatium marinum]|uniref:flagellar basal body-associated FliL family protein n=1 Tax=Rhabdochromatium marinum TaxID=48729 RepID=UPI00190860C7|nr:flagellar basal body-associated FliL family protein [Rhabdochromatium marinum]MBK1647438.1 hypothetical protein [Rhabdochromatium marinum]
MAKKAAKKGKGDEDGAPKKAGKKKLIIILLLALIVLGGGGGAAWYFLLGGTEKAEVTTEPAPMPLLYYRLDKPITATLEPDQPASFVRVNLVLASRDPAVIDALRLHTPIIRNDLLPILGNQKYAELNTPEGKDALRTQIYDAITAILVRTGSPAGIEHVYFNEIVMQ